MNTTAEGEDTCADGLAGTSRPTGLIYSKERAFPLDYGPGDWMDDALGRVLEWQLGLHADVDLAADQQEAAAGVLDFQQPATVPKHDGRGSRQHRTAEFAFAGLRVAAADDRQPVGAQPVDGSRIEHHVRADPHRFLEPVGQGVTRQEIAGAVDRSIDLTPVELPNE